MTIKQFIIQYHMALRTCKRIFPYFLKKSKPSDSPGAVKKNAHRRILGLLVWWSGTIFAKKWHQESFCSKHFLRRPIFRASFGGLFTGYRLENLDIISIEIFWFLDPLLVPGPLFVKIFKILFFKLEHSNFQHMLTS